MRHPVSNELVYGAGIEFGLLIHHVVTGIPQGGLPTFMNLSWDAGQTKMQSRSAVPIVLQVINITCDKFISHATNLVVACEILLAACEISLTACEISLTACEISLVACGFNYLACGK